MDLLVACSVDIGRAIYQAEAYPEVTLIKAYWVPTIRAAGLFASHNPGDAIRELEVTSRYEMGQCRHVLHCTVRPGLL